MNIKAVLYDFDGVAVESVRSLLLNLWLHIAVAFRRCGVYVPDGSPFFGGFQDTIRRIVAERVIVGVVSTNDPKLVADRLRDAGIAHLFRYLVGGKRYKRRAIQDFCELFRLEPERVLFVGDRQIDIREGKKAGVITVAFHPRPGRFLVKGADYHISAHSEVLSIINNYGKKSAM